jgi:hypothetical protein
VSAWTLMAMNMVNTLFILVFSSSFAKDHSLLQLINLAHRLLYLHFSLNSLILPFAFKPDSCGSTTEVDSYPHFAPSPQFDVSWRRHLFLWVFWR